MTIVQTGRNRSAEAIASAFAYFNIGTGTATVAISDIALASVVQSSYNFALHTVIAIANTITFVGFLNPSQGNIASSITELGWFDASTTTGKMLARIVASTNTFTAFTKSSDKSALITLDCTVSA